MKRSTRSAAKSASTKMKVSSGRARQWSKDVDRSLYGSREYASKNPNLSPITELMLMSQSQTAAQTSPVGITAANDKDHQISEADPSTAAVGNAAWKSRTPSGRKARGRALRKRKVGVADQNPLSEEKENYEDQTATGVDAAPGTQSEHDAPRRGGPEELSAVTSELTPCSNSDVNPDCAPASDGEESQSTEPVQKKRGRRSSGSIPVLQEQQNVQPSSVAQEEQSPSGKVLAPWQTDFNLEDVFKPVATRGERSVRRSLRLRCTDPEDGTGLAWFPRNSPASATGAHRNTRGRRLSATLPVQPALPKETRDAS